jgi:hypothetical protein
MVFWEVPEAFTWSGINCVDDLLVIQHWHGPSRKHSLHVKWALVQTHPEYCRCWSVSDAT